MEFKFTDFDSILLYVQCTKANFVLIADYYEAVVLKQAKKQAIKTVLYAALVDRGILRQLQGTLDRVGRSVDEAVRLKELEVELQHLALKDKELH